MGAMICDNGERRSGEELGSPDRGGYSYESNEGLGAEDGGSENKSAVYEYHEYEYRENEDITNVSDHYMQNCLCNHNDLKALYIYMNITIVKNKDIEFQVKDSGIGISKDNINKITQPFFQANQTVSTKGFGLGLTICKKIIESHKGRLSIESEAKEGSIFVLHLPKI